MEEKLNLSAVRATALLVKRIVTGLPEDCRPLMVNAIPFLTHTYMSLRAFVVIRHFLDSTHAIAKGGA